jgi:hypothetical protein
MNETFSAIRQNERKTHLVEEKQKANEHERNRQTDSKEMIWLVDVISCQPITTASVNSVVFMHLSVIFNTVKREKERER